MVASVVVHGWTLIINSRAEKKAPRDIQNGMMFFRRSVGCHNNKTL